MTSLKSLFRRDSSGSGCSTPPPPSKRKMSAGSSDRSLSSSRRNSHQRRQLGYSAPLPRPSPDKALSSSDVGLPIDTPELLQECTNNTNEETSREKCRLQQSQSSLETSDSSVRIRPRFSTGDTVEPIDLEDRVHELELKLAVLSRLLQAQQRPGAPLVTTTTNDRCHSPVPGNSAMSIEAMKGTPMSSATPHLESPAPGMIFARMEEQERGFDRNRTDNRVGLIDRSTGGKRIVPIDDSLQIPTPESNNGIQSVHSVDEKDPTIGLSEKDNEPMNPLSSRRGRNLSLTLLFEGDEEAYKKRSTAPPASSMTPAEREWLKPKILQFQQEHLQQPIITTDDGDDNNDKSQPLSRPSVSFHDCSNGSVKRPKEENDGNKDSTRGRSSSITDDVNVMKKQVRTKWLEYLNSFQESTPDVDVQMEEFVQIPAAVENIMGYGFFICVDSFLYMFSVLPIRFVWNCFLLCIKVFYGRQQPQNPHFQFHRRHLYQLMQVLILLFVYRYVLAPISMGKLYHWIRGQAMIKLYVIIAMVEIFDRLFSSLGQDCLDSMYWNTVSRPGSKRFMVSVAVVIVYASVHALILFVHVATLNVAMNSADQALLSLLISGNFAEIKSTVFKKYNKAALFKITASDICERFKLALFLSLVLLLNICQGMDQKQFFGYLKICGIVWCAELLADWIKHSFITKFNFLPARVYPEYACLLAGDVTGLGHEAVSLDHSHAVVKRIGFAQTPLLCVMFRLLKEAAKYARTQTFPNGLHWRLLRPFTASRPLFGIACICVWVMLLILKLFLGRLLQRISMGKLYAAPEYSQLTSLNSKRKKNE